MTFEVLSLSSLTEAQRAEIEALQKSVYDAEGL